MARPVHRIETITGRKVPRGGFAAVQDDSLWDLRDNSQAFAYFHET